MSDQPEGLRGHLLADSNHPPPSAATRPPAPTMPDDMVGAEEPTGFDPRTVALAKTLPPNVALLCATAARWEGEPSFKLDFYYRVPVRSAAKPGDLVEQRPPHLALATLVERNRDSSAPWKDAYLDVMSWWATKHTLVAWMRELLVATGDPRLIVWDNTDHEIPWELFYNEPSESGGRVGWLGEFIPVLRWTTIHGVTGNEPLLARRCSGGLLMLEDPRMAVTPDGFARYEVQPRTQTMQELLTRLDGEPAARFGLLVIRCHGTFSADTRKFTLGGLSLNAYTEYTMHALRESGALVLLNACVSGRPVVDPRHPGTATRSFAELYLRRGASGVIATVGEVDLNHSHDFAVRLLNAAEGRDLNIGEALRDHRRHYARRARRRAGEEKDNRSEEDFKLFFSSFMYVYFGHPDTVLRTDPPIHRDGP